MQYFSAISPITFDNTTSSMLLSGQHAASVGSITIVYYHFSHYPIIDNGNSEELKNYTTIYYPLSLSILLPKILLPLSIITIIIILSIMIPSSCRVVALRLQNHPLGAAGTDSRHDRRGAAFWVALEWYPYCVCMYICEYR